MEIKWTFIQIPSSLPGIRSFFHINAYKSNVIPESQYL